MKKEPFKFLDAYTINDKEIFFGRSQEIKELYARVFHSPLLLIYGVSGSGKTSLIQCGLGNKIAETDWLPIVVRPNRNIKASLQAELTKKAVTSVEPNTPLPEQVKSLYLDYFKPIYLIFDQFEELFIFEEKEKRTAFVNDLLELIHGETKVKVLFVIREEYLAELTEFEPYLPEIFRNKIRIEKMTRQQAIEVIDGPCRACGVNYENNLPVAILDKLASVKDGVELTYLQVVMDKLYKKAVAINHENPTLTHDGLKSLGKMGDVLADFLEEQLSTMENSSSGRAILNAMVSTGGTKKSVNIEELYNVITATGHKVERDTTQLCLSRFVSVRIITEKDETGHYELRHDALAEKIYELMTGMEKELLDVQQLLESRYQEYIKFRKKLLDSETLKDIAPYEHRLFLDKNISKFVEKSKKEAAKKRKRKFIIASSLIGAFILIVSLFAVHSTLNAIDAEKQENKAIKQREIAEQEKQKAEKFGKEAEKQRKIAEVKTVEANKQASIAEEQKKIVENKGKEVEAQLVKAKHNLGLVFKQKADSAINEDDYNAGRVYSLMALANFTASNSRAEIAKAKSNIYNYPDYPIIFSTPVSSCNDIIDSVEFSPDGNRFVTGGYEYIKLWDTKTGKIIWSNRFDNQYINKVNFSSNGNVIGAVFDNWDVKLFDVDAGNEIITSDKNLNLSDNKNVSYFAFSNDCQIIGSLVNIGGIQLLDVNTRAVIEKIDKKNEAVFGMVFSFDDKELLYGFVESKGDALDPNLEMSDIKNCGIRSFNIKTKEIRAIHKIEKNSVAVNLPIVLSISPDNKFICYANLSLQDGKDGTELEDYKLIVMNIDTGKDVLITKPFLLEAIKTNVVKGLPVNFSADSKLIASGYKGKRIKIYDVNSGTETMELKGHPAEVSSLDFSNDDKMLVSSDVYGNIIIWDVITGKPITTPLAGHSSSVEAISFSPDGKILASGESNGTIKITDVKTGKELKTLNWHLGKVTCLAFSPDGNIMVSSSLDRTVKFWNVKTGKTSHTLTGFDFEISSLAFSPDGKILAFGLTSRLYGLVSLSAKIRLWDMDAMEYISKLKNVSSNVDCLAFSHSGKTLALGSGKSIQLLDIKNERVSIKHLFVNKVKMPNLTSLAFLSDDRVLVSGHEDGTIWFWNVISGNQLTTSKAHSGAVRSLSVLHDSNILASGSDDTTINLWDSNQHKKIATLKGHTGEVKCVSFSPDGKIIATGSSDKSVKIWENSLNTRFTHLPKKGGLINYSRDELSFSDDSELFSVKPLINSREEAILNIWDVKSGSEYTNFYSNIYSEIIFYTRNSYWIRHEDSIEIFNVENGESVKVRHDNLDEIICFAISQNYKYLALAQTDKTIRIFNLATGDKVTTLKGHLGLIMDLCFLSDDNIIISTGIDKTTKIWDIANKKEKATFYNIFDTDELPVFLTSSRSNKILAIETIRRSGIGEIKIINPYSGEIISKISFSADGTVYELMFSHDGKFITTSTSLPDKTIRIWDVKTGIEVAILKGNHCDIKNIGFSSENKIVASGVAPGLGYSEKLKLWSFNFPFQTESIHNKLETSYKDYMLELDALELNPVAANYKNDLYQNDFIAPKWPETHPLYWIDKAENGDANAMAQLGLIYHKDKDIKNAFFMYKKAANAGNKFALERLKFITIDQIMDELPYIKSEKLISEFMRLVERNARNEFDKLKVGKIYLEMFKDVESALRVSDSMKKLNSENYRGIYLAALAYSLSGEIEKAILNFKKVTELAPGFESGCYEQIAILYKLERYRDAYDVMKKRVEWLVSNKQSFSWKDYNKTSWLALINGDKKTAKDYISKATRYSKHYESLFVLAVIQAQENDLESAVDTFLNAYRTGIGNLLENVYELQRYVEHNPEIISLYYILGKCLEMESKRGNNEKQYDLRIEAIEAYKNYIEKSNDEEFVLKAKDALGNLGIVIND